MIEAPRSVSSAYHGTASNWAGKKKQKMTRVRVEDDLPKTKKASISYLENPVETYSEAFDKAFGEWKPANKSPIKHTYNWSQLSVIGYTTPP